MAAPIISISSEESVGSHAPRVILFGAIPAIIPVIPEVPIVPADPIVAPEVGTVPVVSPTGVLDLVDYSSSSDSDPSEDSLPLAPDLPLVSPFLCSDDSEADGESEPAEQRPVSSSHDTLAPLSEFPLAPVVAPPGIHRRPAILVRPGEAIPFGRLYRTHLNGPRKLLTAWKVMAAPIISILSDSFEDSVSSHAPRVILFGAIPAIIPEVPIVPTDPIVAPEDSLPPLPDLPLVSPFLCSDDSEADSESEPAEQTPVSSSHDTLTPSSDFPLAPIVALPGIRDSYPTRLLTVRKRVRPIPARRLAWRRVSHHSSDRHSSPDSSSSSSPSDHSLSEHTPPDTTDADTSTPPRFVHRSLARTPRSSVAFRRWRSAPLSTLYPPTTSESSLGSSSERSLDSSSHSSRPSRKICRSPTASVPSPTQVSRSITPTPADLLPPRKRFRDSYSPEDSEEEHIEVDTTDAEAVADVGISDGVVAHPENSIDMGVEIVASDVREDDEEFKAEASAADMRETAIDPLAIGDSSESSRGGIPDLEDTIYDIVHYMSEVRIDRITEIETT
ncbi:hypothetical protein Tco_0990510 [Tanacetum coccineum]|uniref:Uncharacterized protein n=1 Tax=Tanacetum coccineum TaxID=301880 RepID=A0ABQ5EWN6_9ASTR